MPSSVKKDPIVFHGQRLVMTDRSGKSRRYRVVIKQNKHELALSKDEESKAVQAVLKIISESGLNKKGTNLAKVSITGRVVKYKEKSKVAKDVTYAALAKIIAEVTSKESLKRASPKTEVPIQSESHKKKKLRPNDFELLGENKCAEYDENDPAEEMALEGAYVKQPKEPSVFDKVGTFLEQRFSKKGPQDLDDFFNVVEEMKRRNGKLRYENDRLVVKPSEVGPTGRKASGQNSELALRFLAMKLLDIVETKIQELQALPGVDMEGGKRVVCAKAAEIVKNIYESQWGKACLQNIAGLKDEFESVLKLTITDEHLIRYFGNYEDLLRDEGQISGYDLMKALKSESLKIQSAPAAAKAVFYDRLNRFLADWLARPKTKDQLSRDLDLMAITQELINEVSDTGIDVSELTRLKTNITQQNIAQPKETLGALSWKRNVQTLRSGSMQKNEYHRLVQDVAHDLAAMRLYEIKTLTPEKLESELGNSSTPFERLSAFIAKEILTSDSDNPHKSEAINMMKFFLDVQNTLAENNQLDAFFCIQAALNKTAIQRLNLAPSLPSHYKKIAANLSAFEKAAQKKMDDYSSLSDEEKAQLVPYVNYVREGLRFAHANHDVAVSHRAEWVNKKKELAATEQAEHDRLYAENPQYKARIDKLNNDIVIARQKAETLSRELPLKETAFQEAERILDELIVAQNQGKSAEEINGIKGIAKAGTILEDGVDVRAYVRLRERYQAYLAAKTKLDELRANPLPLVTGENYNPVELWPLLNGYFVAARSKAPNLPEAKASLVGELHKQFPQFAGEPIKDLLDRFKVKAVAVQINLECNHAITLGNLQHEVREIYEGKTPEQLAQIMEQVKQGLDAKGEALGPRAELGQRINELKAASAELANCKNELRKANHTVEVGNPKPPAWQPLEGKDYPLEILKKRGKLHSILINAQQMVPYNPVLATSFHEEMLKAQVDDNRLFLLSYQYAPNIPIKV